MAASGEWPVLVGTLDLAMTHQVRIRTMPDGMFGEIDRRWIRRSRRWERRERKGGVVKREWPDVPDYRPGGDQPPTTGRIHTSCWTGQPATRGGGDFNNRPSGEIYDLAVDLRSLLKAPVATSARRPSTPWRSSDADSGYLWGLSIHPAC